MAESSAQPKLTSDPQNANKGTVRGLGMVERSLQSYGAGRSILASNDGVILAGNKTYDRAIELGIPVQEIESDGTTLFVIRRTDLAYDDPRAKELAIADNRSSEVGLDWSPDVLAALADDGVDLSQFWFEDELAEVLTALDEPILPGLTDPDEVPEPPEDPITKRGDVWLLGDRHRVMCGDSTVVTDVDRLMDGKKADMLFTDPPYGMNLDASFKNSLDNPGKGIKASKGYNDVIGDDQDFDPSFLMEYFKNVAEQFWWGADYYRASLPAGGSWVVWDKRDGMEVEWTTAEFELCWSRQKHHRKIIRHRWFGLIGTEQEDQQRRIHPTQKPIGLAETFLQKWSNPSALVIDLFLGSGSTLIACEQTGRACYGMEISPAYCDVIVKRWENHTGLTATLEAAR